MKKIAVLTSLIWSALLLSNYDANAQFILPLLRLPDASPKSSVSHQLGLTDIAITYHSPQVRGRKIWGGLVPFGRIWRTGANEITTISFDDDVNINGNPIRKGTYGFHIIPGQTEDTLIFSANSVSWGSFSYNKKDDVLRVTTTSRPVTNNYEWLKYEFNSPSDSTVEASVCWESRKIPFVISTNSREKTLAYLREEWLTGPHRFDWLGGWFAANYCFQNNFNHEEALRWIESSVNNGANYTNLKLRSDILYRLDRKDDADKALQKALRVATIYDMDGYIFSLIRQKKVDEALQLAQKNVAAYPDFWEAKRGLARAYSAKQDFKNAITAVNKILAECVPAAKPGWETALKKLQDGKDFLSN